MAGKKSLYQGIPAFEAPRINLGFEQLTGLSGAVSLNVPDGARYAIIAVETKAVRWRDDGTAPTSAIGMPLPVGAFFFYAGDLYAMQIIEQSASASISVSYYK